ncbi:MAG: thioredoxin reductase [Rhodospirillaceae bacterium]|jgi:thioredoxin reductase (NADPH)|nr:thioredoxin reductase [Rhodospirillaceae bacterium]MEA2845585.1 thioredoxin reductase [Rhodospirillaceae bacterium]
MDSPSFDVIVVGAGPAGLTAATQAARAGLKALCLDKLAPGGALINLGQLHDVEDASDGPQVASQLTDDATAAGVEIGFGEVVRLSGSGPWTVETAEGEHHTGRAVVIATGLGKGRLGLPGEDQYEGRGLSHCASCDGPLYAGLPVIVAGAAGWAPYEAQELKAFASEVTVIDTVAAKLPDGVRHLDGRIVALEGSDGLQSVVVESGGARKTVPTSAVFVYVGQSPAAEFVPDSLARDATGHIVVDEGGRTSAATAFAAGDVRAGARHYLADAIADGQRAAQAIVAALAKTT